MAETSTETTVRLRRPIGLLCAPQSLEPYPLPLEMVARVPGLAESYAEPLRCLDWDARMRREALAWSPRSMSMRQMRLGHVGTVAFSWALTQRLLDAGITPAFVFGHSLGLHSALAVAGATTITDTLEVVDRTARFLAQPRPEEDQGALAAVTGFAPDEIAEFCESTEPGGAVCVAIINSYRQVVVSGRRKAVDRMVRRLRAKQAWGLTRLPLRLPLHTPLMAPLAEQCAELTAGTSCHVPHVPLIHPTTGQTVRTISCADRLWRTHLIGMIDFVQALRAMEQAGIATFIEVGLGETLTLLARWYRRDLPVFSAGTPEGLERILHAELD